MNIQDVQMLGKAVRNALAEQGITTTGELLSYSLDDLEALEGIGPKALLQIAKTRDEFQPDAPTPTPEEAAPAIPRKPVVTEKEFTVTLQVRHAEWVEDTAAMNNDNTSHIIEQCVRAAWARDHSKAGRRNTGGASMLADDNPHRNA